MKKSKKKWLHLIQLVVLLLGVFMAPIQALEIGEETFGWSDGSPQKEDREASEDNPEKVGTTKSSNSEKETTKNSEIDNEEQEKGEKTEKSEVQAKEERSLELALDEKNLKAFKSYAKNNIVKTPSFDIVLPNRSQKKAFQDKLKEDLNEQKKNEVFFENLAEYGEIGLTELQMAYVNLHSISQLQKGEGFVTAVKEAKKKSGFSRMPPKIKTLFESGEAVLTATYKGNDESFDSNAIRDLSRTYSGSFVKYIPYAQREKIYNNSGVRKFANVPYVSVEKDLEKLAKAVSLESQNASTESIFEAMKDAEILSKEEEKVCASLSKREKKNSLSKIVDFIFGVKAKSWENDAWFHKELSVNGELFGFSAICSFYKVGGLWFPAICVDRSDTGVNSAWSQPAFNADGSVHTNPSGNYNNSVASLVSTSPTKVRGYYTFLYFIGKKVGVSFSGYSGRTNSNGRELPDIATSVVSGVETMQTISNSVCHTILPRVSTTGDFVENLFDEVMDAGIYYSTVSKAKTLYLDTIAKVSNISKSHTFASIGDSWDTGITWNDAFEFPTSTGYDFIKKNGNLAVKFVKDATDGNKKYTINVPHSPSKNMMAGYICTGGGQSRLGIWTYYNPTYKIYLNMESTKEGQIRIHKTNVHGYWNQHLNEYSKAGAKFDVYVNGEKVESGLTTDENGYTPYCSIDFSGTSDIHGYFVETKSPKGYELHKGNIPFVIPYDKEKDTIQTTASADEPYTYLKLELQKDANDQKLLKDGHYSYEGAVYRVTPTGENQEVISPFTITTDKNGYAEKDKMPFGSYDIQEIKPPKGFELDTYVHKIDRHGKTSTDTVINNPDGSASVVIKRGSIEPPVYMDLRFKKKAKDSNLLKAENYSLAQAVYQVTPSGQAANAIEPFTITTDANGYAKKDNLPLGYYKVKEITPSKGFVLDPNEYTFETYPSDIEDSPNITTGSDGSKHIVIEKESIEPPQLLELRIRKTSEVPPVSSAYSYRGAEYRVTPVGEAAKSIGSFTLVTDENGFAKSAGIPLGKYEIKEIKTSPGFALDPKTYVVEKNAKGNNDKTTVEADGTLHILIETTSTEPPIDGHTRIEKVDAEGGFDEDIRTPQGKAKLGEAEFTLHFDDNLNGAKDSVVPWNLKDPDGGMIQNAYDATPSSGGVVLKTPLVPRENGKYEVGVSGLPIGKYYWKETKAPEGYLLNPELQRFEISDYDGNRKPEADVMHQISHADSVIKIDVPFEKVSKKGNADVRYSGLSFYVHEIGKIDQVKAEIPEVQTNNDGKATFQGLPYDDYQIAERFDDRVKELSLVSIPILRMSFDAESEKYSIHYSMKDKVTGEESLVWKNDELTTTSSTNLKPIALNSTLYNVPPPPETVKYTLETDAFWSDESKQKESGVLRFKDKISIFDKGFNTQTTFDEDKTAKILTRVVNKETKQEITNFYSEKILEAGKSELWTDEFEIDLSDFVGRIVLLEEITLESRNGLSPILVAHKEIEDERQKLEVIPKPSLPSTLAEDSLGSHQVNAKNSISLKDTIEYYGLKEGKTYQLRTVIKDLTGDEIIYDEEKDFVPDVEGYEVEEVGEFQLMENEGQENGSEKSENEGTESNLENENPDGNFEDGNSQVDLEREGTGNLEGEEETDNSGEVGEAEGNEEQEGNEDPEGAPDPENDVRESVTTKFVSGKMDVSVSVHLEGREGHELVFFEYVLEDGQVIASHEDETDSAQQISVLEPELKTKASAVDGSVVHALPNQTLTDTYTYSGLDVGRDYTVITQLMNKVTGKVVTYGVDTFNTETTNGERTATLNVDLSELKGIDVVFFEKIYANEDAPIQGFEINEEGNVDATPIAQHTDIEDKDQTIHVLDSTLSTVATGENDLKETHGLSETTLFDTVKYSNLIQGKTYHLTTKVVVKTTPPKEIASQSFAFSPKESDGQEVVKMNVDLSEYEGESIVFYEYLDTDDGGKPGERIAKHENPNDIDQIVKILKPTLKTSATFPNGAKEFITTDVVSLTDTITYTNLQKGHKYALTSKVVDKENGKVVSTKDFDMTPEKSEGKFIAKVDVNGDLVKGRDVVFFETLYFDTTKKDVVSDHVDIQDKGQTVSFGLPKVLRTTNDRGQLPNTYGNNSNSTPKLPNTGEIQNEILRLFGVTIMEGMILFSFAEKGRKNKGKK